MEKKKSKFINPDGNDEKVFRSLTVEKVVPGGDGLVRVDGKVYFIPGVLQNEVIDFQTVQNGKKFSRGAVLKILKPSEDRVTPICRYYGICGGCNLQHLDYKEQLILKESFVREHFQKLAGINLTDGFYFVPSQERYYRNRVQFHKAESRIGFKMRAADTVIPVDHCPVLVKPLNDFLSTCPSQNKEREVVFGSNDNYWKESQIDKITVAIETKQVNFRADVFFQSNLSILPELIHFALDGYSGNHGMDLYCGVGLFSVFLKDNFKRISAIELNPETETYYRENMAGSEFEYYGMSLEQWLKGNRKRKADFIIVDPPRTGLSSKVRTFLIEMNVPELVYVSCDPVTQARDTKELVAGGYKLVDIRGFDFYPHTHHMETVCRFTRR